MTEIVCVRSVWDRTGLPPPRLPGIRLHELHYGPEPGWPFGRRGLALEAAWESLGAETEAAGMLVLDADVAVDPCDMAAMLRAARLEPDAVHVAPVKLWPASTLRPEPWIWGHYPDENPTRWTFCFTYLPRRLIELAEHAGLRKWTFPGVDTAMAGLAVRYSVEIRVVPDCWPKHMHY